VALFFLEPPLRSVHVQGDVQTQSSYTFVGKTTGNKVENVVIQIIAEETYEKDGIAYCKVLARRPREGVSADLPITQEYGNKPMLLSSIPFMAGFGQRYKGQKLKGNIFTFGEYGLFAASVASFTMYKTYVRKKQTYIGDPEQVEYYNNMANNAWNAGMVLTGATVLWHLVNIADARFSKGKLLLVENHPNFNIRPYTRFSDSGLSICFTF